MLLAMSHDRGRELADLVLGEERWQSLVRHFDGLALLGRDSMVIGGHRRDQARCMKT